MITVKRNCETPKELFCSYTPLGVEVWETFNAQAKDEWYKSWNINPSCHLNIYVSLDGAYDIQDNDTIVDATAPNIIYRQPGVVGLQLWTNKKVGNAPFGVPQPVKDPIDHSKYRCINPAN